MTWVVLLFVLCVWVRADKVRSTGCWSTCTCELPEVGSKSRRRVLTPEPALCLKVLWVLNAKHMWELLSLSLTWAVSKYSLNHENFKEKAKVSTPTTGRELSGGEQTVSWVLPEGPFPQSLKVQKCCKLLTGVIALLFTQATPGYYSLAHDELSLTPVQ